MLLLPARLGGHGASDQLRQLAGGEYLDRVTLVQGSFGGLAGILAS